MARSCHCSRSRRPEGQHGAPIRGPASLAGAAAPPRTGPPPARNTCPAPAAADSKLVSKKGTLRGAFFFPCQECKEAGADPLPAVELTILMPCLNEAATIVRCVEKAR